MSNAANRLLTDNDGIVEIVGFHDRDDAHVLHIPTHDDVVGVHRQRVDKNPTAADVKRGPHGTTTTTTTTTTTAPAAPDRSEALGIVYRVQAVLAHLAKESPTSKLASHRVHLSSPDVVAQLIALTERIEVDAISQPLPSATGLRSMHFRALCRSYRDSFLSWNSMQFDDAELESEFRVMLMLHEVRCSSCMAAFILVAIISEMFIRNIPVILWVVNPPASASSIVFRNMWTAVALALVVLVDFVALTSRFILTARWVAAHDDAVARASPEVSAEGPFLNRSQLRRMASQLEWWTCVCITISTSFHAYYIAAEYVCPYVAEDLAKDLYCRSSFGFSMSGMIITLSVPSIFTPVRLAMLQPLLIVLLSIYALLLTVFPLSDAFDIRRSAVFISPWVVTVIKLVGIILYAELMRVIRWRQERQDREAFTLMCIAHIVNIERNLSSDFLSKQVVSSIPQHVARRMLAGERVVDHYDDGILIGFSIPNFSMVYSRIGTADVVDLLNRTFSNLDTALAAFPQILKMQTIGDRYMCVIEDFDDALDPQKVSRHVRKLRNLELAVAAAAVLDRSVASIMKSRGIVVHAGRFTCIVFGATMAYVAVGPSVSELFDRLLPAARGVVTSEAFRDRIAQCRLMISSAATADALSQCEPPTFDSASVADAHQLDSGCRTENLSFQRVGAGKCGSSSCAWAITNRPVTSGPCDTHSSHHCSAASSSPELANPKTSSHIKVVRYLSLNGAYFEEAHIEAEYLIMALEVSTSPFPLIVWGIVTVLILLTHLFALSTDENAYEIRAVVVWIVSIGVVMCFTSAVRHIVNRLQHSGTIQVDGLLAWSLGQNSLECSLVARRLISVGMFLAQWLTYLGYFFLPDTSFLVREVGIPAFPAVNFCSIHRFSRSWILNSTIDLFGLCLPAVIRANIATMNLYHAGRISHSDATSICAHQTYTLLGIGAAYGMTIRYVHDLATRRRFATTKTLNDEIRWLLKSQDRMEQFMNSITPRFAQQKFWSRTAQVVTSIEICSPTALHQNLTATSKNMNAASATQHIGASVAISPGDRRGAHVAAPVKRVNPWTGNRTATKVVDIPLFFLRMQFLGDSGADGVAPSIREVGEAYAHAHEIVDGVLERAPFAGALCKAKVTGRVVLVVGNDDVTGEPATADLLFRCGCAIMDALRPLLVFELRAVLHHGLAVGAVIGSSRLTFELFGELVSTSTELILAMPDGVTCFVATRRFRDLLGLNCEYCRRSKLGVECRHPDCLTAGQWVVNWESYRWLVRCGRSQQVHVIINSPRVLKI